MAAGATGDYRRLGATLGVAHSSMSVLTDADSLAQQIGIAFVLAFLVVLIVRYVLLLWLGYLHHIESRGARATTRTPEPPVTIIVPVYNEEAVIESALRSLLALRYPSLEIIVVDDGSTDRTLERAPSRSRDDTATRRCASSSKPNGGKASALNAGIALARHAFVLCMDGDSRLDPGTLRAAMRHFADPRVARGRRQRESRESRQRVDAACRRSSTSRGSTWRGARRDFCAS